MFRIDETVVHIPAMSAVSFFKTLTASVRAAVKFSFDGFGEERYGWQKVGRYPRISISQPHQYQKYVRLFCCIKTHTCIRLINVVKSLLFDIPQIFVCMRSILMRSHSSLDDLTSDMSRIKKLVFGWT